MIDLAKLNSPETAPRSGRQFLALVKNPESGVPQWAVIQYAANIPGHAPFWRWQVPGRTWAVEILGWLCEAPFNDVWGDVAIEGPSAWEKHGF